ncbi:PrsW family intramembrane metalloprotease [Patescibacteria group bacterium]|nr:MAG: PrsW family intramembrane metalloprotease [Patescibacteria group bacterium]
MTLPTPEAIFYSLAGGIIPAIVWLLFWLREDKKRPEPRGLIALAFVGGMIAVPLVIPFQKISQDLVANNIFWTFLLWAALEELFKYGSASVTALHRKEMNEPIDALIYMMTTALGFVAVENTLFILKPIILGNITEGLITGNLRFIGASLLHTISSATVGIAMALSFYKSPSTKRLAVVVGLILAIILHAAFNLSIIKETNSTTLAAFGFVWIAIVTLMLLFEKVKTIHPVNKI